MRHDQMRNYEIAGAAHATPGRTELRRARGNMKKRAGKFPPMTMKGRAAPVFPNGPAFDAIWHNLDLWVRKGIPPP